jgi:diadenosine tetraphosphate (Ap4A) HIT family hydrolase
MIDHAAKLHELPDEYLADAMPIAKKIAAAQGLENYNILQVRSHLRSSSTFFHSLSLNLWN